MTRELPPNSAGELDAASDAAFAAVVAAIEKLEANSPQAPGSQVVTRRTESEAATAGNFPSIIATPKKCAAVVRGSGDACRGYAIRFSQFCLFHDPARVQSNREASSRGGRNRAITLEARLLDLDLHDRAGIQALIAQVIRLDLLGALSPRKAARLLRLLVSNACSLEASGRDTVYLENSETPHLPHWHGVRTHGPPGTRRQHRPASSPRGRPRNRRASRNLPAPPSPKVEIRQQAP